MSISAPPRLVRIPGQTLLEAKLALTEFLLSSGDVRESAQWSLDWLGLHAGVRQAVCLVVDAESSRLVGLAGFGVPETAVAAISVPLDAFEHPLIAALAHDGPVNVKVNGHAGRGPRQIGLGRDVFAAVALADGIGLLLVSPPTSEVKRAARWVASVLGPKLLRLRGHLAAETTQQRLERERSLLQAIINAVSDPILLTDTQGRMLIANSSAEALFAARDDESEGRRRAVALNNMLFSAALSSTVAGGAIRRELPVVDPEDGSDMLFELLSTGISNPDGSSGVVSILRNVSDLRRATEVIEENYQKLRVAEAAVRAERDRLDLIIDAVVDPILVTDPGGAIVMMNTPAERLFTVTAQMGTEAAQRVRANDAHFTSFVSNLLFAGDLTRYRGYVALVEPETMASVPVEAIAGKVLSTQGELIGVVAILHDRTEAVEKERLYEQLKKASDELELKVREATSELARQNELLRRQALELEQASALKSQFLANMSHEFRTPLNAILGYTSMLLQGVFGELSAMQKKNLTRVDSNGRHLLALINDILDISRIEAGRMPLHVDQFPLPELMAEVTAELEAIITRSRLTVTTDVGPDIPELTSDRQKVKQIVLNLLSNAIKFTPKGAVKVVASHDADVDEIAIAVIDTGIGIAPKDQERVFEDFRQADNSPTREYGGAGLGLSICRRLATMLGGRLTLTSKLGEGSTFTLIVPRTRSLR